MHRLENQTVCCHAFSICNVITKLTGEGDESYDCQNSR